LPFERSIRQPPIDQPGRSIWRYMNLWKFEDVVRHRRLFFARLRDLVDSEVDENEGALAKVNFDAPQVNVEWMLEQVLAPGQDPDTMEGIKRQFGDVTWLRVQEDWTRDHTFVNCWFIGEFESQRMWDEYGSGVEAVALDTTCRPSGHLPQSSLSPRLQNGCKTPGEVRTTTDDRGHDSAE
jgi:hypothetical protein